MTDEQQSPKPGVSYDALRWMASIIVAAVAVTGSVIGIVQYLQQKSVRLEAEFFPSEIAFAQIGYASELSRQQQYRRLLQEAFKSTDRFEVLSLGGKPSKWDLDSLSERLASDTAKEAGPLAQLEYPPTGQMRVVVTNSGDLPAAKVRLLVPNADLYVTKKGDLYVPIPHSDDGVDLGSINQGRSITVFAFTRYGGYDGNFCAYRCDAVIAYEEGLGTVAVRVPRTLFDSIMNQSAAVILSIYLVAVVGVIATIALIVSGIQSLYQSVTKPRG